MRRFAKFGSIFRTNVLFNPMVVVTDETEVERLLKVHFPCHSLRLGDWLPDQLRKTAAVAIRALGSKNGA